jgi:hypothetical protein
MKKLLLVLMLAVLPIEGANSQPPPTGPRLPPQPRLRSILSDTGGSGIDAPGPWTIEANSTGSGAWLLNSQTGDLFFCSAQGSLVCTPVAHNGVSH